MSQTYVYGVINNRWEEWLEVMGKIIGMLLLVGLAGVAGVWLALAAIGYQIRNIQCRDTTSGAVVCVNEVNDSSTVPDTETQSQSLYEARTTQFAGDNETSQEADGITVNAVVPEQTYIVGTLVVSADNSRFNLQGDTNDGENLQPALSLLQVS